MSFQIRRQAEGMAISYQCLQKSRRRYRQIEFGPAIEFVLRQARNALLRRRKDVIETIVKNGNRRHPVVAQQFGETTNLLACDVSALAEIDNADLFDTSKMESMRHQAGDSPIIACTRP